MFTGLVFLDLRTFRAGQRLLPRDLTGNRIPAIILSLSRKPGSGVFPNPPFAFWQPIHEWQTKGIWIVFHFSEIVITSTGMNWETNWVINLTMLMQCAVVFLQDC